MYGAIDNIDHYRTVLRFHLPDISHCNLTFNQQHLYWRLLIPLDVETTILVEPNFIWKIWFDFDQNASW
jgi:hypothetical protein